MRAAHAIVWQNIALAPGIKAAFLVQAGFGNASMRLAVFAGMAPACWWWPMVCDC